MNKIDELKNKIDIAESNVEYFRTRITERTANLKAEREQISQLKEQLAQEEKVLFPEKFGPTINANAWELGKALRDAGWKVDVCFGELRAGLSDIPGKGLYLASKYEDLKWEIQVDNMGTQVLVPIFQSHS